MATGRSEFDTVVVKQSVQLVGKGMAGFSNVKSNTLSTLKLVG